MSLNGLQLGAPGIYHSERPRSPDLRPVRLDVAGFAGVAPRGPVDRPVAVESWADFRWQFGGTEGPGLLPLAVRTFFAQGGQRAVICRFSPLPRAPDPLALEARALYRFPVTTALTDGKTVPAELDLMARDEGSWGGRLVVDWRFDAADRFSSVADGKDLMLPAGTAPVVGSTLRVYGEGLPAEGVFRAVETLGVREDRDGVRYRVAVLDHVVRDVPGSATYDIDIVTVTVTVTDTDPRLFRQEVLSGLGLREAHPRHVRAVLEDSSRLVEPVPDWPATFMPPDLFLTSVSGEPIRLGKDRYQSIGRASMFGDLPAELLPREAGDIDGPLSLVGADALSLVPEVALLAVPDLFWSMVEEEATTEQSYPRPRAEFAPCEPDPPVFTLTPPAQRAWRLDARTQMTEVVARQRRLVDLAAHQQRFVALLDVPENLSVSAVTRWRANFSSTYAAAYHPWLAVMPDLAGSDAAPVPPSAFAAGIIADRERRLGLPWGPANALAVDAVRSEASISDAEHSALSAADIDVFRAERDGFRLTSARTLSDDPQYRQLSVRRLMTMLRLVLERQSQWLAFEPHTAQLRRQVARSATQLLRDLFRGGALAGKTEEEAFFVRCDEALNPPYSSGLGRLVAEVGVAPASPLEYLVLRIAQDAEGIVSVGG